MTDETNVMKGLHSRGTSPYVELNKKLTCLWSLCQQINTLFLCSLSFLPGSLTLQCFKALCCFFFSSCPSVNSLLTCFQLLPVLRLSPIFFQHRMFLAVAKLSLYLNIITLLGNMKHSLQDVSRLSGSAVFPSVCAFVD